MARYFLGVDGGQSSTTALIGDESGKVIGLGRGGPCNHVSGPEARARFLEAIGSAVSNAREAAGLAPDLEFEAASFGFSGGPADKEALVAQIVTSKKRLITHDALIALSGAHGGLPGLITIAGTGSICYGRNSAGRVVRVGGWGYVFGDEGGGFDLTRQALRAALRMEEGWGPATTLRDRLLAFTGAKDANDLLHKLYTPEFPRPRVASMSGLVEEAAQAGDAIAAGILTYAAQQLAGITLAARRQIFEPSEQARASYIGGVFRSRTILQEFQSQLEASGDVVLNPPQFGPGAGALLEAYKCAGFSVTLSEVPAEK